MHTELHPEEVSPEFLRHMNEPENVGDMDNPSGRARMTGQCGDSITVAIQVEQEAITDIRVRPEGCAYTLVCASALSVLAKGRTLDQALVLEPEDVVNELGGLPQDHYHCARLALNTLGEAITDHLEQAGKKA